jgi:ABC-type transport system involved in cytochrome c biogenesis permease subunit
MRLWIALLMLLVALPVSAAELDFSAFRQLPVVEEGRLKPLDSFAAHLRTRLAGEPQPDELTPSQWLAQSMFNPAQGASIRTFRVDNAHLRAMFTLPERPGKIYSLAELASGLATTVDSVRALMERDAKTLSRDEQELMALHANVLLYNQLLQSFSLVLPLPMPAPASLELGIAPSFLDAQKIEPRLAEEVKAFLTEDKIENPEKLSAEQQQRAAFLHGLQQLRDGGSRNQLVRIIPSAWQGSTEWYSPWQLVLSGQGSPQSAALLGQWQELARAYRAGDAAIWQRQSTELLAQSPDPTRLRAELHYRDWQPYDIAFVLFALSALLALLSLKRPALARPSWWLLAAATLTLTAAIAGRMYILQRPPVGTLHESVLFVALVVAASALWLARARTGLTLAGGLGAMGLLIIAPLIQSDSENMTMLSAVLNSNFWLTVHVLCITAGYGACALTALLAHGLLATHGSPRAMPQHLPLLHRLSLISLLLTAVGTLLGGVWADQSWGRFWGWDPKENGALIIVLWLIWLQHGRLAGQIGELAYLAGMSALGIVVAQAWFGVNLLSTGLHSYGFIEGIALGLFSYTVANSALIVLLWWLAQRRLRHAA